MLKAKKRRPPVKKNAQTPKSIFPWEKPKVPVLIILRPDGSPLMSVHRD